MHDTIDFRSSLCRRRMWTGGAGPGRSVRARGWPAARGTGATRRPGPASASPSSPSSAWSGSSVRYRMKNKQLSQKFCSSLKTRLDLFIKSLKNLCDDVVRYVSFILLLQLLFPMKENKLRVIWDSKNEIFSRFFHKTIQQKLAGF